MRASRLTSASRGTLCKVNVSRVRRLAIIKGNAAFLAPLMGMVPVKRWPPTMRIRSMTLLLPHAPAPVVKTPVFAGGRTPVRPPPTHQSTPPGLTLSPLITIPRGLLGFGLSLAFQQIRSEFGFQPRAPRLGVGLFFRFVFGLCTHAARTRCCQPYNPPLSIGIPAGGLRLACAGPLWQGRARKRAI